MKMASAKVILRALAVFAAASALCVVLTRTPAAAQTAGQPSAQGESTGSPSGETSAEKPAEPGQQAEQPSHKPKGIGGELAEETREADGEEHANLKYSAMVEKFGKLLGLDVHQAYLAAHILNFAIIAFAVYWLGRKSIPAMMRGRSASIQRALQEARAASQDANRRLADIEGRLRQMDTEIGKMQASAEKEAEGEEARIQKAAEDEIRKVVEAAEQEIAAAAKQARRDLSAHTADLAISLARKQIHVDMNTDQVLVRDFAAKLAGNGGQGSGGSGNPGKDGR